jgi:farnesyl-diphosphate farnesyltransferase
MKDRALLVRTSRTFYLTIRVLPREVRDDVALAYLLARATDTIADTSAAPVGERASLLRLLRFSFGDAAGPDYDADRWASCQGFPAEADLLRALPGLQSRLPAIDPAVRVLLGRVMDSILEGQIFDLERFGPAASPLGDDELERYTYCVAGSVGEFWDDLCRLKLSRFATAAERLMRTRARHYGQALQLVNILRDRRMDATMGRVYLREEDVPRWTEQARAWLREGADYCTALRSGRLRYATLLPALLGWRTLALAAAQPPSVLTPAKVHRSEVRQWMWRALPVWWSASAAPLLARRAATEELPRP